MRYWSRQQGPGKPPRPTFLQAVADNPGSTVRMVQRATGNSLGATMLALSRLVAAGKLVRTSECRTGPHGSTPIETVYRLPVAPKPFYSLSPRTFPPLMVGK